VLHLKHEEVIPCMELLLSSEPEPDVDKQSADNYKLPIPQGNSCICSCRVSVCSNHEAGGMVAVYCIVVIYYIY